MDFNADHFALFDLPREFRIDPERLDKRYREMQSMVHPDRYANASEKEKRLSMQWATRINEAYQVLKAPLSRAAYLLRLSGEPLDIGNNTAMPPEFLAEQMEWREAVAEARLARELTGLEQLYHRVKQRMKRSYEQLAGLLDDQADYALAGDRIKRLMFLDRLLSEIDSAMAALET
ncbi:MAG: Fe-S protein assembly co-chaperone HscB [Candidatus Accumulibacter sp.]|nr:Fe-S protein assembly co-chaperone HscB [Accumulibacter sp.]